MTCRVVYADSFTEDVDRQVEYLLTEKVPISTVERWFTELYVLLDSLEEMPRRFPLDRVLTDATGRETRKINVGDYLVFYHDDTLQQVNVVGFMHGARRREA